MYVHCGFENSCAMAFSTFPKAMNHGCVRRVMPSCLHCRYDVRLYSVDATFRVVCYVCVCVLVPQDCPLCTEKGGAYKRTDYGGWAHVVCALWSNRPFGDVESMEPITGTKASSMNCVCQCIAVDK